MLRSRIPQIADEIQNAVPNALKQGAELVVEAAKERVPVKTGALRDAIHEERVASGGVYASRSVMAGDRKVFYGHMVEHGTSHSPAHPFLLPAFEEKKAEVEKLVQGALKQASR